MWQNVSLRNSSSERVCCSLLQLVVFLLATSLQMYFGAWYSTLGDTAKLTKSQSLPATSARLGNLDPLDPDVIPTLAGALWQVDPDQYLQWFGARDWEALGRTPVERKVGTKKSDPTSVDPNYLKSEMFCHPWFFFFFFFFPFKKTIRATVEWSTFQRETTVQSQIQLTLMYPTLRPMLF